MNGNQPESSVIGTGPGVQMLAALKAVRQMHYDCIKLFEDLDKSMPHLKSFYGNVVSINVSASINTVRYMAQGLIRLYFPPGNEAEFLSINIGFDDADDPKFTEPIFIAARITYDPGGVDQAEKLRRGWDAWHAYSSWASEGIYDEPMTIQRPAKRETIDKVIVVASPLFSINSLEKALALIDLVGRP